MPNDPIPGPGVALLDVDLTLLDNEGRLNKALLHKLKENGIKDLYLFTDMTMKPSQMWERSELITELEKQEFKVHGVITPLDLTWTTPQNEAEAQKMGEEALAFKLKEEQEGKGKLKGKKLSGAVFDEAVRDPEGLGQFSFIQEVMAMPTDKMKLGSAFEEGQKVYLSDLEERSKQGIQKPKSFVFGDLIANAEATPQFALSKNIGERALTAKFFGDEKALRRGYKHVKGFMLEAFLRQKPDWVGHVFIADDAEEVHEAVDQYKQGKEVPPVPIDNLSINTRKIDPQAYDAAIKQNIERTEAVKDLDSLITSLKEEDSTPRAEGMQQLREGLLRGQIPVQKYSERRDAILGLYTELEKAKSPDLRADLKILQKALLKDSSPETWSQKIAALKELNSDIQALKSIIESTEPMQIDAPSRLQAREILKERLIEGADTFQMVAYRQDQILKLEEKIDFCTRSKELDKLIEFKQLRTSLLAGATPEMMAGKEKVFEICNSEIKHFEQAKGLSPAEKLERMNDLNKLKAALPENETAERIQKKIQALNQISSEIERIANRKDIKEIPNPEERMANLKQLKGELFKNPDPTLVLEKLKALNQVDQELGRLNKSKYNFFLDSPKHKISAMEHLKDDILRADLNKQSLSGVIKDWEEKDNLFSKMDRQGKVVPATVSSVLSMQRNPLKSGSKDKQETSSQDFVSNLKDELKQAKKNAKKEPEEKAALSNSPRQPGA